METGAFARRGGSIRRLVGLAAIAAACLAATPGSATAATDFGNGCTATTATAPNVTLVMTAKSALNPLPIAAPIDGIITGVRIALPSAATGVFPVQVETFRATGVLNEYKVIAATSDLPVTAADGSFDVRLPVRSGDLLGLTGSQALACNTTNSSDVVGAAMGIATVGSTMTYPPTANVALPVVATVEADADGDGFGDETQDKCPALAQFQTPCPVIILDSFAAPGRKFLTMLVSTTNPAQVTVTGTVKVKKVKRGRKGKRKGTSIKLIGGTQAIDPGPIARFKVRYPRALKKALKRLPARKSVKATLTATATDTIGRVSSDTATARLPGSG